MPGMKLIELIVCSKSYGNLVYRRMDTHTDRSQGVPHSTFGGAGYDNIGLINKVYLQVDNTSHDIIQIYRSI